MQPFDVTKLAKKLVRSITSEEIKDIIFYNFFNLDKSNRKKLGDEVLKLGGRDVIKTYQRKVFELKKRQRAKVIADQIIEEIEILAENENDDVERMVDDALKLIDLATQLKPDEDLKSLLGEIDDKKEEEEKDFLKLRLDFYKRYGKAGERLREKIISEKWESLKIKKRSRKRRRKSKTDKKKRKSKYKRVSRRFRDTSMISDKSCGSKNSILRNAMEFDRMTDFGGENITQNSFSSEEGGRINIFTPIKNKKVKSKFRKVVKKTSNALNYFRKSKRSKEKRHSTFLRVEGSKSGRKRRNTVYKRHMTMADMKANRSFTEPRRFISENDVLNQAEKSRYRTKSLYKALRGYIRMKQEKEGILKDLVLPEESKRNVKLMYSKLMRNTSLQSELDKGALNLSSKKIQGNFSSPSITPDDDLSSLSITSDRLSQISSVDSSIDKEDEDLKINLEKDKEYRNIKEQIDQDLRKDIVMTISSKINNKYLKILKKKRKKAASGINHKELLNKLIITSLKGQFKGLDDRQRKGIKKMIKRATKKLASKKVNTAGDLLMKMFTEFNKKNNTEEDENEKMKEENLDKMVMRAKLYDFKTGKMKKVAKNKMLEVLNQFDQFYEHLTNEEVVSKEKAGEFDQESLLDLLKRYLDRVMSEFEGWSNSDKAHLNEIINRTKKAFFSHKLKKRFISNKKDYVKMNVFERLNNMETFSLKRLFNTLKTFLLRFRGTYREEMNSEGEAVVYELRAPEPNRVDDRVVLEHEVMGKEVNELGMIKLDVDNDKLGDYVVQNPYDNEPSLVVKENNQPLFDPFDELKTLRKLQRAAEKEMEALKLKSDYDKIDEILEKIAARALFELIDFSQIKKISNLEGLPTIDELQANFEQVRTAFEKVPLAKMRIRGIGGEDKVERLSNLDVISESNKSIIKATMATNLNLGENKDESEGFSSSSEGNPAEEFLQKYRDKFDEGNFGLLKTNEGKESQEETASSRVKVSKFKLEFSAEAFSCKRKGSKKPKKGVRKVSKTHRMYRRKKRGNKEGNEGLIRGYHTERGALKKSFVLPKKTISSSRGSSRIKTRNLNSSRVSKSSSKGLRKRILPRLHNNIERKASLLGSNLRPSLQRADSTTSIRKLVSRKSFVIKTNSKRLDEKSSVEMSLKSNMFIPYLKKENTSRKWDEMSNKEFNQSYKPESFSKNKPHSKALDLKISYLKQNKVSSDRISKRLDKFYGNEGNESQFSDAHISSNLPSTSQTKEKVVIEGGTMTKIDGIIKGANFSKGFIQRKLQRKKQKKLKKEEFVIKGEPIGTDLRYNYSYSIFNTFRKCNHNMIIRAKLALLEVLTHENLDRIAKMDASFLGELKKKVESRLTNFMKKEIFLSGDMMREVGNFKIANQKDYRVMPSKVFISPEFKFNFRDLNVHLKKIE